MTEFATWHPAILAQFAHEARERMTQQDAEIEALRADLRMLLSAQSAKIS
jgi:hypothetical protein